MWIRRNSPLADIGRLSRDDVVAAYRWMLGREPEDEQVVTDHAARSPGDLIATFVLSPEFHRRWKTSPYFHYNAAIDVIGIIQAHENKGRTAKAGHIVNFLGVALEVDLVPLLAGQGGTVEALPIPGNWHAEMSEFAATLRAVDLARERFTMVELGCGWGCWMNITGVAARRRGLETRLVGVEGDPGHIGFAQRTLETNGFAPADYRLWHGIAGATTGTALFPSQDRSGVDWGLEPKFGLTEQARADLLAGGRYEELPVLALSDIVEEAQRVDLLHMDIQGGEADFTRDCIAVLSAKVSYLVIGTHSRQIEGQLMTELTAAGWTLEIERPSVFAITRTGPVTVSDGIQGWRNPHLIPL